MSRRAVVVAALIVAAGALASACTTPRSAHDPGGSSAAAPGSTFPAPRAAPLGTAEVRHLEQAVADVVATRSDGLTAASVAVVSSRGSWSYAMGHDGGGQPLVPTSMMPIGSITKTFTAAEVMHLAAIGKLDLEAPLSRYVHSPLLARRPTVRQVLGMLSGVTDGTGADNAIARLTTLAADRHVSAVQAVGLNSTKPATPGTTFNYANTNFQLLGEAIAKITGRTLTAALDHDVIGPAGLQRIAVQDEQRPSPPFAYPVGADPIRDGYLPDRAVASGSGGAGAVAADAPTVARWGYELYGGRVLSAHLVKTMITEQKHGSGYGLGTVVWGQEFTPADTVGHNGLTFRETSDGLQVGYASILVVDPSHHLSLAIISPDRTAELSGLVRQLLNILT